MLRFSKLITPSENSTVHLVTLNNDTKTLRKIVDEITRMGCSWETPKGDKYYAVNIPANIDFRKIKKILDAYRKKIFLIMKFLVFHILIRHKYKNKMVRGRLCWRCTIQGN
jgi:hypothetical protein